MHPLPQHTTSLEVQPRQIVWRSAYDQTSQYSPGVDSGCSLVDQQVMDQFAQMKTMLSSFVGPGQETTRTAFCIYLASEVEALENRDFQTSRNKAVKLLSSIQSKADERRHQPQQPQEQTVLGAQVQLQHLCHRHFNSNINHHQLPGDTSYLSQRLRCQQERSSNPLSRAKWQPKDSSNPEGV